MEYSIRRLTGGDVPTMQSLNMLFGEVFDDMESYKTEPPSSDYLKNLLADKNNVVLVAESEGLVIGGLVAYVLNKFEKERCEVYVYDLAVATEYHRKGVGRALMKAVRDEARNLGAYVVFVQADEGDEAVRFYESLSPAENLKTRNFDFDV